MAESILIVDDHSGFRECARRLLESEGCRVVGEAHDCASAVTAVRALEPDLALVDVYLPDGDGIELASRLRALDEAPVVVLISSRDGAELQSLVANSGARGFVAKGELSRAALEQLVE